jgi:hypothetical protein
MPKVQSGRRGVEYIAPDLPCSVEVVLAEDFGGAPDAEFPTQRGAQTDE